MPRKVAHQFQVEYIQVIDQDGNADSSIDPNLPAEDLRRLYKAMLQARMVDDRMYKLQAQGRMGTFPGVRGQEANVGAVYAMIEGDWVVPAFRETSSLFLRGCPIKNILQFFMGMEEANVFPERCKILPIPIAIGSQTVHAAGVAWANKIKENNNIVLCFFGDGGTSEGDFHEACNMAGIFDLPVVFVCMNNQWAISVPRTTQSHSESLAQKAIAYGFPGVQVDGNDVLAGVIAGREAIQRARSGKGPTMIEFLTYRLGAHTTADDPKRYRSEEEVKKWVERDPIKRFKNYLERKNIWTAAWQEKMEVEIAAEIEAAVKEAETVMANLDPMEMFDHIYAEKTPDLEKQKEQAQEFAHEMVGHGVH